MASKFPFSHLSKIELNDLYGLDFPSQLQLLPNYELRSKLSHIPTLDNFDLDENYVQSINSNYFDILDLQKLNDTVSRKHFSLLHVNTRSLSKNFDQLLTVLSGSKINFDVIGISKTKQKTGMGFLVNVDINNYFMYTQPSKLASGGVAIYVNDKLDHSRVEDMCIATNEFEVLWVEIKNKKGKNFLIGCAYRHPNTDPINFIEYIETTLAKIHKNKYEIFFMGDFNIDLLQYDSHNPTNDFVNSLISHSFLPYIHQPTRVTDHSATIIDNIFSNITGHETMSGNITTMVADHFAQFLLINKCHISYKSCSYFTFDYTNFAEEKFVYDYSNIDWSSLNDQSLSVDHHFDNFYAKTSSCVDSHVPKKKVTKRELKLRTKPWINADIQKLMHYRDKYFQKMKSNPSANNKYLYHKFRNRVVSEQRRGKFKYFKNYFEKHKTNMKMLWTGIKSIINVKAKNQISLISHLTDNGSCVHDPVKMASIFNKFFVNVGPNIDKSIPRSRKAPLDYLKNSNPSSLFLAPVTPDKIEIIIKSLNTKKSIGPYSIPVFLLKILSWHIAKPLAQIVNLSFYVGMFPSKLKVGKVSPLHKKGSCDNPSNYRPISILSVFSKIFEKLMHQRLYKFLEAFEILYPLQFGFREKHSTSHALLSLTESIKQSIDSGKVGCGIFLDLQKAFDTVNHKILLDKLEHYGIRGNALKWFQSYLSGRTQYVTVNGHVSDPLPITCGVPQGSVLGPLLFLIYVNDLPNVSKVMQFYLFADDTSIYFDSDNLFNLQKIVNRELKKVRKWLEANRLALNIDKTNYVIFHSPNNKVDSFVRIKLGSKPISRVDSIKYLGVLIDSTLSWKPHIVQLSKKLARTSGIF